MNSLKYKLMHFMSGRYGTDKLNNTMLVIYFILWILNLLVGSNTASLVLDILQLGIIILIVFRMMSKNIFKRRMENEKFLRIFGKILPDITLLKSKYRDRHTHIYKKCPSCKAVLRLKKIKGEHTALCPKCKGKVKVIVR